MQYDTIGIEFMRGVDDAFTTVAEVTNIGDLNVATDTEETTTYASLAKEFIALREDGGSLPLTLNFDPDEDVQGLLRTDQKARTVRKYRIRFPIGTVDADKPYWEFDALITSFGTVQPLSGKIALNVTLKITGQPELVTSFSNNLSALVVTTATLVPVFAAGTYDYIATVANATSSVTVTPTATLGVITVNGAAVTSGQASGAIALAVGINTITVVVKETNKGPRTYRITIGRLAA